ncbi:caspase-8 Dredd isoform X2 [Megachile rotundata]|uniref:caspase-8 Dredd isoform X2 n=1 Tax=Megachile rotundata TaxID=143995 RepID=UPI00061505BC|nr:PREDICTED: caspase-8 isoform X2 [Megachile rotundata]
MDVSTDALQYSISHKIDEENLSNDVLMKIGQDLDIDEIMSILFLITDNYGYSFNNVMLLSQDNKSQMLVKFVNNIRDNRKEKLLEALCIIQNKQIIRKLGILFDDLQLMYLPRNRVCSRHVNSVAKCLYFLCEALTENRTEHLVKCVKSDMTEYKEELKDTDFLELHIFYWLQQKYISIDLDGKISLKNLLKHLKTFDDLELIYEDLKRFEDNQNVLDVQHAGTSAISQLQMSSAKGNVHVLSTVKEQSIRKVKTGLCIIISQMVFIGQKYETRFGNLADCIKLLETFKGFSFRVEIFQSLKKDEMLKKLEDIPKDFGTDYDCIFVCILSHGCKGGVITSDEETVNIETIEHKICCIELADVIKIVIIQACQGEVAGKVDNDLTTDSPMDGISNILAYKNFCMFMSTMQNFLSVRHKTEGIL